MAAVTMGTKADRMQYELPSMPAHAQHEIQHGEAMAHGSMDHDMSDPKMANDGMMILRVGSEPDVAA